VDTLLAIFGGLVAFIAVAYFIVRK